MGSSEEQPGDIYVITVRPAEFVTVPSEQWRDYETEAERLRIQLRVGPVSHGRPDEIHVGSRLADTRRRWGRAASYDGPVGCKRPRWEHALRELLNSMTPASVPPPEQI